MAHELAGRTVAVLATDGVDDREYIQPRQAVEAAGGRAELVSLRQGHVQAVTRGEKTGSYPVERTVAQADPESYDALLLPGGVANPDRLRTDSQAVAFVRTMALGGKPIGVICHGAWTLVEADVLVGRTLTSWPSLRTDILNAGGTWVDEPVQVDEGLVSSRGPDDLPVFCATIIREFAKGRRPAMV